MNFDRRKFLKSLATASAAAVLPGAGLLDIRGAQSEPPPAGNFDFIFFTDTHIQPELDAAHGCAMAFAKIAKSNADFAICGGDLVFDAMGTGRARADMLFDLYQRTEDSLKMPLHHTIGNHDLFGILSISGIEPGDPHYGKKMYEDRFGAQTYYSFDHKGYHFIVLDSVAPTPDRQWEGRVDAAQLHWLVQDLAATDPRTPVVVITHVPLITGYLAYGPKPDGTLRHDTVSVANSSDVTSLFAQHNILVVLQGHLHINELVHFRNCQYACCGAVCGNWWHGPRLAYPEGYTRVSLNNGNITWRYETYGFKSVDPRQELEPM
ncbi:MAG: metallophosphoesterase [Candidatus Acidiferrales bacterium]